MSPLVGSAAVVGPCLAHKLHAPTNLTSEFHHVIPVGWQLHTPNPSARPSPGEDTEGRGMLWDDRGVVLCPTGHRNVHHWIPLIMRALIANPAGGIPGAIAKAVPSKWKRTVEVEIAHQAFDRAASCSVDFAALAAVGQWGQS